MAVALSLSQLRAQTPTEVKRNPSLLYSPARAAKIPLSEQAALAENSLELLATIDPFLPTLASRLNLPDPKTRLNLEPSERAKLSEAVIDLAAHLSPLFPVRHAQRVLEWVVNGLHAGLLAPDAEVDALLVAALPFHATPQFPAYVAALLLSKPLQRWTWLRPVGEQRKPPSVAYLVKHSTQNVHVQSIDWALGLARRSVPVASASAFLANVTARWVVSAQHADRRIVLLKALVALEEAIALVEASKLAQKQCSELVCAALTIAAAGVVGGVGDDVVPVVGRCIVKAFRLGGADVPQAALACLSVLVQRHGQLALSKSSAMRLLRSHIHEFLVPLGNRAVHLNETILLCALGSGVPDLKQLSALKSAVDSEHVRLLSDTCISRIITRLLDNICSGLGDNGNAGNLADFQKRYEAPLTKLLAPLARGRYASAVDEGLRTHFDSRPKSETLQETYEVVGAVLSNALEGTRYEVAQRKDDGKRSPFSGESVMVALNHPSEAIRSHALHVLSDRGLPEKAQRKTVSEKLLAMVEAEGVITDVANACKALHLMKVVKPHVVLRAYAKRLARYLPTALATGAEKSGALEKLVVQLLQFCAKGASRKQEVHIAVLIGFFVSSFKPGMIMGDTQLKVLESFKSCLKGCQEYCEKDFSIQEGNRNFEETVTTLVGTLTETKLNHSQLLEEVSALSNEWALKVVEIWLSHLSNRSSTELNESCVNALLSAVQSCTTNGNIPWDSRKSTISRVCKVLLSRKLDDDVKRQRAKTMWGTAIMSSDDAAIQHILHQIASALGLSESYSLLRDICQSVENSEMRRNTLRWYFFLAKSKPRGEHQSEAVIVMLLSLYGDDGDLRREAMKLCIERAGSEIDENNHSPLSSLQQIVRRLPTAFVEAESENTQIDLTVTHLRRQVLSRNQKPEYHLQPLNTSTADSSHMQRVLESLGNPKAVNDSALISIPLLRATQGLTMPSKGYFENLTDFLISCLSTPKKLTADSNSTLEALALAIVHYSVGCSEWQQLITEKRSTYLAQKAIAFSRVLSSSKNVDKNPNWELAKTTLVALLGILCGIENKERKVVLSCILSMSASSSESGVFARGLLSSMMGKVVHLRDILPALRTIHGKSQSSSKRPRLSDEVKQLNSFHETALGALEGLYRWVVSKSDTIREMESCSILEAKEILWNALSNFMVQNHSKESLDEEVEYRVHLIMDTLRGLYNFEPEDDQDSIALIDFKPLLNAAFYPGQDREVNETATITAVRRSSLELIETLAPINGEALCEVGKPLITKLTKVKNTKRSFRALRGLIPCLLTAGCSFDDMSRWLCEAAYDRKDHTEREQIRHLLVASCKSLADVKVGVSLSLRNIQSFGAKWMSVDSIAIECCLLVVECGLDSSSMFEVIKSVEKPFRCPVASAVLQNPVFNETFAHEMNSTSTDSISEELSEMYVSILQCKKSPAKALVVKSTLQSLPLPGLTSCTRKALSEDSLHVRLEALKALSDRLDESEGNIRDSWRIRGPEEHAKEKDVMKARGSMLKDIGEPLCNVLESHGPQGSGMHFKLKAQSLTALELLGSQYGPSNTNTLLGFADVVLKVIQTSRGEILGNKVLVHPHKLLAASLQCLSSFVTTLRTRAISFIPNAVDMSLSIIEDAFLQASQQSEASKQDLRLTVLVAESAVRTCTSVIESAPSVFGHRAMKRLIHISTRTSNVVVQDLVTAAVQNIPLSSGIVALLAAASEFTESGANHQGLSLLASSLKKAVGSFSKAQLKSHSSEILSVSLKSMEHGREGEALSRILKTENESSEPGSGKKNVKSKAPWKQVDRMDQWIQDCRAVDESNASMLCAMVLRMSETEFKKQFDLLDAWAVNPVLPEDIERILAPAEEETLRTVPRLLSFLRISFGLFSELQSIFIPYFLQLLDRILAIISLQKEKVVQPQKLAKSKKRSRVRMERDEKEMVRERMFRICSETQDVAMDCLAQMLRQEAATSKLTAEMVSRMQGAVLSYLTERASVSTDRAAKCFCALATRIVDMGNAAETKEESRAMLNGMARELLLRTQETDADVRKAALVVSEAVAGAIGEEYLVTLPESMPVLAEVIDDEDDDVQKAAKSFATEMGALAGEPILEQLK